MNNEMMKRWDKLQQMIAARKKREALAAAVRPILERKQLPLDLPTK